MKMTCENASALVALYLDGELSEAQAGPLRAHLLDCPACRECMKRENAVKRWFQGAQEEEIDVPQGFAARIARRIFAGDTGLPAPMPAASGGSSLLPFVLVLSAAAAVLLLVLSIALERRELPRGQGLDAGERAPWHEEHGATPDTHARPGSELERAPR